MSVPRVEFHSGLDEPLRYACRLLRKAWRQGVRAVVTAPPRTLLALDRELWTFEPEEFVPHRRVPGRDDAATDTALALTPIWLCDGDVPEDGPKLLVNLGAPAPADVERFERIIELVARDDDERREARTRWRAYETRGLVIEHHDRRASA